MPFSKVKDQDRAIAILRNAINSDHIAQSYLFYGPEGVGKFTTALLFAMALICESAHDSRPCGVCRSCKKISNFSHPDFLYLLPSSKLDITPEGEIKSAKAQQEFNEYVENKIGSSWKPYFFSSNTEIRIDSIRMLQHKISRSPFEAKFKIFLIENADEMKTSASNAFLKTLEEPPSDSIIIMTTSKVDSLLPTILSRCQKIPFSPLSRRTIENELEEKFSLENVRAKFIARIANGNMKKALQLASQGEIPVREELLEFLELVAEKKEINIIEFIERYKSSTTNSQLEELISYLITWLGDIAIYNTTPQDIVNIDQPELMQKYVSCYNSEKVPNVINRIEFLKGKLSGHVNPQLILTDIFFILSENFS